MAASLITEALVREPHLARARSHSKRELLRPVTSSCKSQNAGALITASPQNDSQLTHCSRFFSY